MKIRTSDLKKTLLFKMATKIFPYNFLKHYIYPIFAGRNAVPYDPREYFESRYNSAKKNEFSDGVTISPVYDRLHSHYYYNATENTLIEVLTKCELPEECSVLDIGSGAGHWLRFYKDVVGATEITGLDISETCVRELNKEFSASECVTVQTENICDEDFDLGKRFDIINAIGVMFHIVDDELWERAIKNLGRHLKDGGVMLVAGQFGWITQNVQFHGQDDFKNWDEYLETQADSRLVNKRIRSLRRWRRAAARAGLRVSSVRNSKQVNYIYTPENRILVLER